MQNAVVLRQRVATWWRIGPTALAFLLMWVSGIMALQHAEDRISVLFVLLMATLSAVDVVLRALRREEVERLCGVLFPAWLALSLALGVIYLG